MSSLPEGFEGFQVEEKPRAKDPREAALAVIGMLKKDDVFKLGRARWKVWKEDGITRFLIKAGTKGEKFYVLDTISLEPLEFGVRQVLGGGVRHGDVVARGLIIPELRT